MGIGLRSPTAMLRGTDKLMNQNNDLTKDKEHDSRFNNDADFLTGNLKKDITFLLVKHEIINKNSIGNLTLHINSGAISRIINGLEIK
jgi:hypothetical protein